MNPPQILFLALPGGLSYTDGIIRGIHRYLAENNLPWEVEYLDLVNMGNEKYAGPIFDRRNGIIGLIAFLCKKQHLEAVRSVQLPIVNVSRSMVQDFFPEIVSDDQAIGRMAAEYFINKGFVHFGYVGIDTHQYSALRQKGYTDRLAEAGFQPAVFTAPRLFLEGKDASISPIVDSLAQMLKNAPKPFALFCTNDIRANRVIQACRRLGFDVPRDIAVLGVDVEPTVKHNPGLESLSSIQPGTESIGFHAAHLIKQNQGQKKIAFQRMEIPPVQVVSGLSTDIFQSQNDDLRKAMEFIHHHFHQPIRTEDVAAHSNISRRKLERLFKTHLNTGPHAEILRMRLYRGRQLVLQNTMDIESIAFQCGFTRGREFYQAFRRETGLSPTAYRKKFQSQKERLAPEEIPSP